jgi:hypothetical protein
MFLAGHNVFLDKVVTLTFKIDKPDLFMKHSLVVCYNKTQYKLILSGRHIYACVSYCCNEEWNGTRIENDWSVRLYKL